jgi:hypothetical protein
MTWSTPIHINGDLILNPNTRPPGFELRRHDWVLLNLFCTSKSRCAFLIHRWSFGESPACDCGAEQQTMDHIENKCPLQLCPGGLLSLNDANPDAV